MGTCGWTQHLRLAARIVFKIPLMAHALGRQSEFMKNKRKGQNDKYYSDSNSCSVES